MKTYYKGQKLRFTSDDFDGRTDIACEVTEVGDRYAVAQAEGIVLWIDDDTEYQFSEAG